MESKHWAALSKVDKKQLSPDNVHLVRTLLSMAAVQQGFNVQRGEMNCLPVMLKNEDDTDEPCLCFSSVWLYWLVQKTKIEKKLWQECAKHINDGVQLSFDRDQVDRVGLGKEVLFLKTSKIEGFLRDCQKDNKDFM